MWQVLLAAAVAGSTGFVANHFLGQTKACNHNSDEPQSPLEDTISQPLLVQNGFSESRFESNSQAQDGVFRFSSSESLRKDRFRSRANDSKKKAVIGRRQSKHGVRVAKVENGSDVDVLSEQSKEGKRLTFSLKRRKTTKNLAGKTGFCSSKARQSEISKLNKAMDETAKVVQELQSELHRRKSSRTQKILDFIDNTDMNSRKMSGRNDAGMIKKTSGEVRDTDVGVSSLPAISDDGECGSSALTEVSNQPVLEMKELEAALELELQKLCTIDSPDHEEMRPKLRELQVGDEGCDGTELHGVVASELNQKLSNLLIERQETQIAELESELHLAQSKVHEKEAELQALKDTVRRLTQLSVSTVSDDETDAGADQKGNGNRDSNIMDCESKPSIGGVKRPIDFESCPYYLK